MFNCQYRLAPETELPGNVLDGYAALKYVLSDPDKYGIDKDHVAVYGVGGGGLVSLGLGYHLAKEGESALVSCVIGNCPCSYGDHWFKPTGNEYNAEVNDVWRNTQKESYKMLTG